MFCIICRSTSDEGFRIDGKCYCESCAEKRFSFIADIPVACDECGEQNEFYYRHGNEVFCESCFRSFYKENDYVENDADQEVDEIIMERLCG